MAGMKFSDLPPDDPLRIKIETRVLEIQQNEIYRHTVALFEAQKMWDWWKNDPLAKVGVRQREFVERILWNRLEKCTQELNHALGKLYGEPIEEKNDPQE